MERERYGDTAPDIEIRLKPKLATIDGVLIDEETGEVVSDQDELETVAASEFAGVEPPPREWHVPDLIPSRTVTILTGDGATGKSLLALQLAVASVRGAKWIGNDVSPGRALFLTAEDELAETHRRLAAIAEGDRFDLAELGNLRISSLAGRDAILAAPKKAGGLLETTALFRRLACTIGRHRPSLVILDTLADLFGGDEINRAQARQFIGMLRGLAIDFDTTVLLLAHPSLSGMNSGSGNSGSTAWNNSVRSRLYLRRVIREENRAIVEDDPDVRELATVKANYGRSGDTTEIRWVDGRFVAASEAPGITIGLGAGLPNRAEEVFVKLLRTYLVEGRNVSCNPSSTYAPRVFASDDRCERMTATALQKAMNALLERGIIENVPFGPPSKGRVRLDMALPQCAA